MDVQMPVLGRQVGQPLEAASNDREALLPLLERRCRGDRELLSDLIAEVRLRTIPHPQRYATRPCDSGTSCKRMAEATTLWGRVLSD